MIFVCLFVFCYVYGLNGPSEQCQSPVPSHGEGLKSNQIVNGYFYNVCATTAQGYHYILKGFV